MLVNLTEYFLQHPDKLEKSKPEKQKIFWDQRQWHPVVQMRWMDGIVSDGKGLMTFPDGSKHYYNGQSG